MPLVTSTAVKEKQETVNELIEGVVRIGMESRFSEPIVEAVEDATGRSLSEYAEEEEEETKSRRTKALQGIVTFVVMFAVLYVALRQLSGED